MIDFDAIRFIDDSYDDRENLLLPDVSYQTEQKRIRLLSQSLRITRELTPGLFDRINKVAGKLDLDLEIDSYVYNSPDINAFCFSYDNNSGVALVFSSTLINTMTFNELDFVIGHELGHFIFEHLKYARTEPDELAPFNDPMYELQQAGEISADRIGLLATNSLDTAIKAMIKTVSGLKDDFLTDSIHAYLRQVRKIKASNIMLPGGSHPIFPIRARALLLFSMSEYYHESKHMPDPPFSHDELEAIIRKELAATTLKLVNDRHQRALASFKEWLYIKHFLDDKRFNKREQQLFEREFGKTKLERMIGFISEFGEEGVQKKYDYALNLFRHVPRKLQNEFIDEIKNNLGTNCLSLREE